MSARWIIILSSAVAAVFIIAMVLALTLSTPAAWNATSVRSDRACTYHETSTAIVIDCLIEKK